MASTVSGGVGNESLHSESIVHDGVDGSRAVALVCAPIGHRTQTTQSPLTLRFTAGRGRT